MKKVTIAALIEAIEQRQPVLNKASLCRSSLMQRMKGVGALDQADASEVSFLADERYLKSLSATKAGVVLVLAEHQDLVPTPSVALVVASPYLAYASSSQLFDPIRQRPLGCVHPSAVIGEGVSLGDGVSIGPNCVIGAGARIGNGSQLFAQVIVGDGVTIGSDCVIFPQVVIGDHCKLGDHVRIHSQASIGMEGFGFAPTKDPASSGWERIAQLGCVVIGDHVRIGSQTCIDRGAIADTVIGDHVIIDNLVQIAHNVTIGAGTAIAAKTGIAGSTRIGRRCIIGGAVGISGHLEITDDVTLTAMTMVTKSISQPGSYSSGTVAMPTAKWRRAAVRFRQQK